MVNPDNFLPYISDRYDSKNDILEEIDRNERSFKMVAEKMIQKSSQLVAPSADDLQRQTSQDGIIEQSGGKRLRHFRQLDKVANRFHGDVKV